MDRLASILDRLSHLNLQGDIVQREFVQSGLGGTCDVFTAWSNKHNSKVAVKRIRVFLQRDERFAKRLAREINIWASLNHECVLPFLGYFVEESDMMPNLVSLWMENGTVDIFMDKFPRGGRDTWRMLEQINLGLEYLHSKRVIHADLKSANILVSKDFRPQLTDFGISTALSFSVTTTTNFSSTGTVRWMAIELFEVQCGDVNEDAPLHTEATDIWAFGMIAYELICGHVPFKNYRSDLSVPQAIIRGELPTKPDNALRSKLFDPLWKICLSCWSKNPKDRPTATKLAFEFLQIEEGLDTAGTDSRESFAEDHNLSMRKSPEQTEPSTVESLAAQIADSHIGAPSELPSRYTSVDKFQPPGVDVRPSTAFIPPKDDGTNLHSPIASPLTVVPHAGDRSSILFFAEAKHDYDAVVDATDDLDLRKGDIIGVTWIPYYGWWCGMLMDETRRAHGRTKFPGSRELVSIRAGLTAGGLIDEYTSDGKRILFYAEAISDHKATSDEELELESGDLIAVTSIPDFTWWGGMHMNKANRVPGRWTLPCNYVSIRHASMAPIGKFADDGKPILFYVKAKVDYKAVNDKDFNIRTGDIIAVTTVPKLAWYSGDLLAATKRIRGRENFPGNYVSIRKDLCTSSSTIGAYMDDGRPILFYAEAQYNFEATTDDELGLKRGDIIAVTSICDYTIVWWGGMLMDRARRIPGRTLFLNNCVM